MKKGNSSIFGKIDEVGVHFTNEKNLNPERHNNIESLFFLLNI